jgi:hypothetical protein
MSNQTMQALGEPDLLFAGWKLWVVGRDEEDWFTVWTVCEAEGARVKVGGSIIYGAGLSSFLSELKKVWKYNEGHAELENLEPNIWAELSIDKKGSVLSS